MGKAIMVCRVCGKSYEACHTLRPSDGTFRWQDVACSPEHGNIYLERILESRSVAKKDDTAVVDDTIDESHSKQELVEEIESTDTVKKIRKRRSKKDESAE